MLNSILETLRSFSWQDWVGLAGFAFGVISIIAYMDQRRAAKGQADIIEFVKRNVAKDISEETIKQLQAQREAMEKQVNENVPALARAAVLKEQAEAHATAISQHFLEWKRIQQEVEKSPSGGSLDPAVEKIIVDRLVPKYERQIALDKARNRVTVLSVALALTGSVLPSPLDSLASLILAWPLVYNLLKFFKLNTESSDFQATLSSAFISIYLLLALAALAFGGFLFMVGGVTPGGKALRVVLVVCGGVALVLFVPVRKAIRKTFKSPVEGL